MRLRVGKQAKKKNQKKKTTNQKYPDQTHKVSCILHHLRSDITFTNKKINIGSNNHMYEYVILQVAIHQTLHVVHEYVLKILTCLKFRPNLSSSFRKVSSWPKVQVESSIQDLKVKKYNKTTKPRGD